MSFFNSFIRNSVRNQIQQQDQTPNNVGSSVLGGLLGGAVGGQPKQPGLGNIGQIAGGLLGGAVGGQQTTPTQPSNPAQNNPTPIQSQPANPSQDLGGFRHGMHGGIFRNFFGNSPITRANNNLPKQRWGRLGRLFGSVRQPQNQQPIVQQNPQQMQGVNQVNPMSTFSK